MVKRISILIFILLVVSCGSSKHLLESTEEILIPKDLGKKIEQQDKSKDIL